MRSMDKKYELFTTKKKKKKRIKEEKKLKKIQQSPNWWKSFLRDHGDIYSWIVRKFEGKSARGTRMPGNVPVVARQTGTRQQCTPGGSPFSVLWDERGGKIDGNDKENVFDRPPHRVKRWSRWSDTLITRFPRSNRSSTATEALLGVICRDSK